MKAWLIFLFMLSTSLLTSFVHADSILAANCAVSPILCNYQAQSYAYLDLQANTASYQTPVPGALHDSKSITGVSAIAGIPFAFTSTSSGSVTDNFGGIHASLSTSGSIFCGSGLGATCPYGTGGYAGVTGQINDYFATGSVPNGSQLQVTYSVDAVGNTGRDRTGSFDSTVATSLELRGNAVPVSCTSGTFALHFTGSYATVCTGSVSISSDDLVALSFIFSGSATVADTSAAAILDASDTAKISSVLLVDSQGNPLSGVPLYDASGYDYDQTIPAAVTPEPSGLVLLGTGLFSVVGIIRKRFC